MSQGWYYTQAGQQVGPVDFGYLQQLAATGRIGVADLVWCEGMANWAAAPTIPGLMPGVAAYGSAPPSAFAPAHAPSGGISGYPVSPSPYGAPGLNYYGQSPHVAYAGFWLRFVAALLDGIIMSVVNIPIMILTVVSAGGLEEYQRNPGAQLLVQVLTGGFGWLYFALQESSAAQATLGKRALGLVVIGTDGQRIGFGKATGRYFGKILSTLMCFFGYFMIGWTEKKQGLHDMMAGTYVIQRS